MNSLPQLPSAPSGLPVAFVLRRLLQAASLAEAAELVLSLPHATNQHYLIAEPGAARSFEASCEGVSEYRAADPARLLHTNHPLVAASTEAAGENSVARLESLTARLAAGQPGLAEIEAALSSCDDPDNPVCRIRREPGGLAAFTTGSMISSLECSRVEARVSAGPPSMTGYASFSLAPEVLA